MENLIVYLYKKQFLSIITGIIPTNSFTTDSQTLSCSVYLLMDTKVLLVLRYVLIFIGKCWELWPSLICLPIHIPDSSEQFKVSRCHNNLWPWRMLFLVYWKYLELFWNSFFLLLRSKYSRQSVIYKYIIFPHPQTLSWTNFYIFQQAQKIFHIPMSCSKQHLVLQIAFLIRDD